MTLSEYLDLPDKTATGLARQVGCSVSTITRAAKGDTIPNRTIVQRIYECTGKQVPPNSFYGLAA
jgi:predicted transcriptional regulator